jgi:mediator of RNA polymerase II transcription subunit 18
MKCRTVSLIGGALKGAASEQVSALVRNREDSKVSSNALRFFYALGYKLDHELLRVGFAFHIQRAVRITVSVTSVQRIPKLHAIDEAVPVTPGLQLVEVSAPSTSDNYHEAVAAISAFSEFLSPYYSLLFL